MRLLIVQFVHPQRQPALPEYHQELAVAVAVLRRQGVEVDLVALGGYRPDLLRQAVNRHRPSHVLMDLYPSHVTAARHAIVDLAERYFLPVIVVGPYATCQPDQAISIPGVAAMVVGEYEQALGQLLGLPGRQEAKPGDQTGQPFDAGPTDIPGVWLNGEDGLIRNDPGPPVQDLDALPLGEREIFNYARTVEQTGKAVFFATRGCPLWCCYCLNDWYLELYGANVFPRRRSVGNLVGEVSQVVGRYPRAREVVFDDHAFAADAEWLERLAEEYPRCCDRPFGCHVRLNWADARVAGLLARAGCRRVDVEIGSGSDFIRQEVLGMPLDRRQVAEGVRALRQAGLEVRGSVFVGAPYDGRVAVEETLELLAELQLQAVRPRVYYPVPGTAAAEVCRENGWISGRGEENFLSCHSVLDMPALPARAIEEIVRHFAAMQNRRRGRGVRGWVQRLRRISARPLGRRRRPSGTESAPRP